MKNTLLAVLCLTSTLVPAQEAMSPDEAKKVTKGEKPAVEMRYEVKTSQTLHLNDGTGRKVIMQRAKPLVIPEPPAPAASVEVDPRRRAARRAEAASEAKKERRLISLTGIYYPNGQTLLQWFMLGPDGQWATYEAWTLMDLRAAWLVQEFEVGNTIYDIFPSVHPASPWDLKRDFPGPLWFAPGSPGFRLIKGNPAHTKSLEPIAALIKIFRDEGPDLTAKWLKIKGTEEMEQARLKANPPPVLDIVIQVYPYRSNFFPDGEAEYEAALAAGRAQAAAANSRE